MRLCIYMDKYQYKPVHWLLILLLLSTTSLVKAQCLENKVSSFSIGERVDYEVYYNWGFIWVHAGEVYFKVSSTEHKSKKAYHFISEGKSRPSYDWLYKVRDRYESKVTYDNFKPLWFIRDTNEGGFKVDEEYHYMSDQNKVAFSLTNSKGTDKKDTLDIQPCSYDVLATVYHARTIDFDKYKSGDKIPISVLIDGELHPLYIRYLGRETIETRDKKKYRCIKFKPLLVEGSIFKGGEDMTVWVTDDKNKIPVLVEAKILVGSIKAYLSNTTGIRHPQTSLVQ